MHLSLSISAIFALYGQAYSQKASGYYNIGQVESPGHTLYLDVNDFLPVFEDRSHEQSQVWNFASAGEGLVTIQNAETENYINCERTPGDDTCELKDEAQVFRESRRSNSDTYIFSEQSGSKALARTEEGSLALVSDSEPELFVFTLTLP